MKTLFKKITNTGREYFVDLKNNTFLIKDGEKKVLEMPLLAYKHNLFHDTKKELCFDLEQVLLCVPGLYDRPIQELLQEIERSV